MIFIVLFLFVLFYLFSRKKQIKRKKRVRFTSNTLFCETRHLFDKLISQKRSVLNNVKHVIIIKNI